MQMFTSELVYSQNTKQLLRRMDEDSAPLPEGSNPNPNPQLPFLMVLTLTLSSAT